ncbi:MAG TPA: glycosyltransferase [Vitreimonas sp.]|nr:glycosyltransferase [Vitreimonas sp.]
MAVARKKLVLKKIVVVVPVYNEALFITDFLQSLTAELKKLNRRYQVTALIVNDGSQDQTAHLLKHWKDKKFLKVITHQQNRGKGAALRTGIEKAQAAGAQAVVVMDGDCQHEPGAIAEFITHLQRSPIVFGYRDFADKMSWVRQLGNGVMASIFKHFFTIKRRDPLCGFMAFRSEMLPLIQWQSDDYGVEAEIAALVAKRQLPFTELKIATIYLDKKTGLNLRDATKIMWRIPSWFALQSPGLQRVAQVVARYQWSFLTIVASLLFLSLAFKYPFQPSSLIGNLEPYPDTLYYSVPAWNLTHGDSWSMSMPGHYTKQVTPPLYSWYLLLYFFLINDVRVFYLANLVLSVATIALLVRSLKLWLGNNLLAVVAAAVALFLYVTQFYIYTVPTLLMAENITLFLIVASLWSLLSWQGIAPVIAGFLPLAFLLIKFSNAPVALVIGISALLRGWFSRWSVNKKVRYVVMLGVTGLMFICYVWLSEILVGHKNLAAGQTFSNIYFRSNTQFYLQAVAGGGTRFLWFTERLISPVVSLLAAVGIVVIAVSFNRSQKILSAVFISLGLSTVVLMSFFVTPDARYVMIVVPIMILFTATTIKKILGYRWGWLAVLVLVSSFLVVPGLGLRSSEMELITIKKQIGLNFKYQETPWNYLAVKKWQEYLVTQPRSAEQQLYVGTFLPPYYVHVLGLNEAQALPITLQQEFMTAELLTTHQVPSVKDLYATLLQQGHRVFVSEYYANNLQAWPLEYKTLTSAFQLTKVHTGCLGACDLYELSLKTTESQR